MEACFKGALRSFLEKIFRLKNFNILDINEVMIQIQKYLSFPHLSEQDVLSGKSPEYWVKLDLNCVVLKGQTWKFGAFVQAYKVSLLTSFSSD